MTVASAQEGHVFGDEDIQIAEILAGHVATALGNARLAETNERRATQLEMLHRVTEALTTATERREVMRIVVRAALELRSLQHVQSELFSYAVHSEQDIESASSDTKTLILSGRRNDADEVFIEVGKRTVKGNDLVTCDFNRGWISHLWCAQSSSRRSHQ